MKLIIQIPCYNEEKTLPETVADLPREIDGIDTIEYLIINDGSTDNTEAVALQCGVHHIVHQVGNKGLAKGFMAGISACLSLGADIIVNTDADNQYVGADIPKLVKPLVDKEADIVVGARAIEEVEEFSPLKKKLQRLGSWVVRVASNTEVPDAPSGFRAYTREAALHLNVINNYTYTLETIIQAGHNSTKIATVPIRTNPATRKSRRVKSMRSYIQRSSTVIIRSFLMYRPLTFFGSIGAAVLSVGVLIGVRFLTFFFQGTGDGHVQSLLLAVCLILLGMQSVMIGLQADTIAANRKILEDIQYHVRKNTYDNSAAANGAACAASSGANSDRNSNHNTKEKD